MTALYSRKANLFQAVLNRIRDQGDMHIRIRGETFRLILEANGVPTDMFDHDQQWREVDAWALETLIRNAKW